MLFDPFGDFESHGYLRNCLSSKDPSFVKKLEYLAFRDMLPDALTYLLGQDVLRYHDVLQTHRILFESVFPWAGEDRTQTAPNKTIKKAGIEFALPYEIERAVNHALQLGQDENFIKQKPGVVMGYLAYGHPFLDGNGRVITTVHAILAHRAGIHIDWSESTREEYLTALTRELQEPDKGHLDAYLGPRVAKGEIPDLYKHLMRIRGLNDGLGESA